MPVPKRKTSKSRRDMRQSTKFIRPQAVASCAQCQEATLPHQVCTTCGYYKGKKIMVTKYDRNEQRAQNRKTVADKQSKRKASGDAEHDDHQ